MKVGFLITGRMKSTRLKRKLTIEVEGRQIVRWMIDRIKLSKFVSEIVLCTSLNGDDDILEQIAKEEGIKSFRGHEEDVISRLNDAAMSFGFDFVLNITADCPLVSFEYIDTIVETYRNNNEYDLIRCLDLPHGFFSYGIKPSALAEVCRIKKDINTEVWGRYFADTGLFRVYDLEIPESFHRPNYRLTLDYPEDLDFFKSLYAHWGERTYKAASSDIIEYLDRNPEIVDLNKSCKELYQQRWDSQNKLVL